LICLQVSGRDPKIAQPTAYIESMSDQNDYICSFKWLQRPRTQTMNGTYIEGSKKGKLWIRDIYVEYEKMLKIPTDFTDKIKDIHYNADKNVVFVSCRDGKSKCYKLPSEWGSDQMEMLDSENQF
jgi:hypothetical protein